MHVHPAEDEIFVMVSGSGLVWIEGRRFELAAGGVAFLPRGIPHAYRFSSDNVDMLAIATPSGMEDFFRDAGRNRSRPKPAGWAVTPEALSRATAANGQIVLGPPLAVDAMFRPLSSTGIRDRCPSALKPADPPMGFRQASGAVHQCGRGGVGGRCAEDGAQDGQEFGTEPGVGGVGVVAVVPGDDDRDGGQVEGQRAGA